MIASQGIALCFKAVLRFAFQGAADHGMAVPLARASKNSRQPTTTYLAGATPASRESNQEPIMEEPEVPIEKVQEHIEHHAHSSGERWVSLVALSTAILAALAAISSLLAGDHANEAMIDQIKSSDQWAYYQAKGIKTEVVKSRAEILKSIGKPNDPEVTKLDQYAREQAEIKAIAQEKQTAAETHLHKHVILARGVTLFQIAIAIGAISVLTRRKGFWGVSLAFGSAGIAFLIQGILFH